MSKNWLIVQIKISHAILSTPHGFQTDICYNGFKSIFAHFPVQISHQRAMTWHRQSLAFPCITQVQSQLNPSGECGKQNGHGADFAHSFT